MRDLCKRGASITRECTPERQSKCDDCCVLGLSVPRPPCGVVRPLLAAAPQCPEVDLGGKTPVIGDGRRRWVSDMIA